MQQKCPYMPVASIAYKTRSKFTKLPVGKAIPVYTISRVEIMTWEFARRQ